LFNWFKTIFGERHGEKINPPQKDNSLEARPTKAIPADETKFIWCLVGNIADTNTQNETNGGSRHFQAGKKVYCLPPQWGDSYENIKVIGRHRDSNSYICIVMHSKYITNWRHQKVYRPYILNVMHSQFGWKDNEESKKFILELVQVLSERESKKTE